MATAIQYGNLVLSKVPGVYLEVVAPEPTTAFTTGLPLFFGYGSSLVNADGSAAEFSAAFPITRLEDLGTIASLKPDIFLTAAVTGFFDCGGAECRVVLIDPGMAQVTEPGIDPAQALVDLWSRAIGSVVDLEQVDLLCAPSLMNLAASQVPSIDAVIPLVQAQLLAACDTSGTRFAILDSAPELDGPGVSAQSASLGTAEGARSGALYYPWLLPDGADGFVPPCGHVAGVYSRTDQSVGPQQAPANVELAGVIDLAAVLSDGDQAALVSSVNPLRAFPGRGLRVWGARTLDTTDDAWTFVNVRRLFTSVTRWLKLLTAWSVFEPNDLRLWIRLTRQLDAYLLQLFQSGGLKGATAADAYFVQCDGETNPPELRDQGQLVVRVGLAPARPGEFIVIRLVQSKDGTALVAEG